MTHPSPVPQGHAFSIPYGERLALNRDLDYLTGLFSAFMRGEVVASQLVSPLNNVYQRMFDYQFLSPPLPPPPLDPDPEPTAASPTNDPALILSAAFELALAGLDDGMKGIKREIRGGLESIALAIRDRETH